MRMASCWTCSSVFDMDGATHQCTVNKCSSCQATYSGFHLCPAPPFPYQTGGVITSQNPLLTTGSGLIYNPSWYTTTMTSSLFNYSLGGPQVRQEPKEKTKVGNYMMGFRGFIVRPNDDWALRLFSSNASSNNRFLPGETHAAVCNNTINRADQEKHNAPEWGCHCGYYAFNSLAQLSQHGSELSGSSYIIGGVRCTGTIVQHESGFRAEKVQLVALLRPSFTHYRYIDNAKLKPEFLTKMYNTVDNLHTLSVSLNDMDFTIREIPVDTIADEYGVPMITGDDNFEKHVGEFGQTGFGDKDIPTGEDF